MVPRWKKNMSQRTQTGTHITNRMASSSNRRCNKKAVVCVRLCEGCVRLCEGFQKFSWPARAPCGIWSCFSFSLQTSHFPARQIQFSLAYAVTMKIQALSYPIHPPPPSTPAHFPVCIVDKCLSILASSVVMNRLRGVLARQESLSSFCPLCVPFYCAEAFSSCSLSPPTLPQSGWGCVYISAP